MVDKIYLPETIETQALPIEGELVIGAGPSTESNITSDSEKTITPNDIPENLPPAKIVASDLLNSSFNSQSRRILGSYQFGVLGALQIGTYENGVSGDVKISPSGIVARNTAGVTSFSLDGETGDATFLGTVAAGSIISASVSADLITAGTISVAANLGDTSLKLDGANRRILINDGSNDRILLGKLTGAF